MAKPEVCWNKESGTLYQKGDLITYGSTGVCRVVDIIARQTSRNEPEKMCYVLEPLYQKGTITTPVDNGKVITRPIMTREEALDLIDQIPNIHPEVYYCQNLQQLENLYKSKMEGHDCMALLEVTISTHQKKREREKKKLKFGAIDQRYMERAENLLFGELAVALGIAKECVQDFIIERLGLTDSVSDDP